MTEVMKPRPSPTARRRGRRLALAAALSFVAHTAVAQVAVDELEVSLQWRAGATSITRSFHAANPGDVPANATISIQDWDRSERGENRYYPLGSLPSTCGSHVKVFPSVLRLEPRSVQTIQVTIDSADALPRGCYAILFVETARTHGPSASGLVYSVRYGVKVYVERAEPPRGEVTAIAIEQPSTPTARADTSRRALGVSFHNSGAAQTNTHGSVEVRRLDDSVVATIDVPPFLTLPGATRRLTVAIPPLPTGRYVLLALLDYGGQEIAAGQVTLEVP